jgi:hypothetical protein
MRADPEIVVKLMVEMAKSLGYDLYKLEIGYLSEMAKRPIRIDYTPDEIR